MYTLYDYGAMIADGLRKDAYVQALHQTVTPGCIVLDIGTGAGFFACLACQFGARKVYALEPHNVIHVARRIANANGYADRIIFIQDFSTQVTLPERVDVIISDLRGTLPVGEQHIPDIVDARERFLAPGGTLVPQRDSLWASVVNAPNLYGRHVNPWENNGYGLDMRAARHIVLQHWCRAQFQPDQWLTQPQCGATLDYTTITDPKITAEFTWTVHKAGVGHGIHVWFDAELAEGIGFSNAPGQQQLIYQTAFFPWLQPVLLAVGDRVSVVLRASPVDKAYVWGWHTRVIAAQAEVLKAEFQQSTFYGQALSSGSLRTRASNCVPTLNEEGKIERFILHLMDGKHPLEDIARQVAAQFPSYFPQWRNALIRVGELSQKYGGA